MPSLQLDGLTFGRGDRALAEPLDLQAEGGEVWAILGENGVGKSSLLLTLAGLLPVLAGRVFVDGVDIRRCPRKVLARRVGLLLQQSPMDFPFTVTEAVGAGRYAHRPGWQALGANDQVIIRRALASCGLEGLAEARVDRLSGGEQRRVAMATLLTQAPGVLLLDEPVNHLDLRHQAELMATLCALAREQRRLVVMTVHDINLAARYADRVLLLYPDGHHDAGSASEMLSSERLQRVYSYPVERVGEGGDSFWRPAPRWTPDPVD
ncbi:ABC transporter ATP-binding protein [Marinobacter sp. JSM 1782161]|uniref:ABC transporter ATP-binding protein n=1 Tax=Marinobacter sp. JSM 1782161 TaxID=2685906 RepID=UPI0014024C6A|nr:ABC transporter ATP-binding protein [Marinobacter sp. JSM 1782161]